MKYQHDGFFKRVVKTLTDKEKLTMPVVIKEATENIQLLEQYQKRLKKTVDEQEITSLNQKIKLLELGIKGENSVLFELKNSFLPIHILHDIRNCDF